MTSILKNEIDKYKFEKKITTKIQKKKKKTIHYYNTQYNKYEWLVVSLTPFSFSVNVNVNVLWSLIW